MMRFILRDRSSLPAARRSFRRLLRCALAPTSLALCLLAFVSVGDGGVWLTASASPASAATGSSSAICVPLSEGDQPFTASELAHPYTPGLRLWDDGAAHACSLRRAIPAPSVPTPIQRGQVILVSRSQQWLWAYQDGHLAFATPVATGQPDLPTPLGVYHVMLKRSNMTFYSPWPKGSPYYYAPLHIDYALLFRQGGFYIHDAPWRYEFGPGANLAQQLPDGSQQTGSHGCVDVPTLAGAWLYRWARVGATVVILDSDTHQTVPAEHTAAACCHVKRRDLALDSINLPRPAPIPI